MYRLLILTILFFSSASTLTRAQCVDFHLGYCAIPDFSYFYNQQSKSFELGVGQTGELKIIVYENTDYYISVCKHRKFSTLQFKVYEDNGSHDLLYDNATNGYADTLKFTSEVTRKLILELTIPAGENPTDDTKPRCTGILIASRMRQD
ncbi:MAG: hypothetical protein HC896_03180 [Bacteroidales bacterium]|nr:hypothetical protein [Bacteroidales bacterium]